MLCSDRLSMGDHAMKCISLIKNMTVAKVFVYTISIVLSGLIFVKKSIAQPPQGTDFNKACEHLSDQAAKTACIERFLRITSGLGDTDRQDRQAAESRCNSARQARDRAFSKVQETCSKLGMGSARPSGMGGRTSDCMSRADECNTTLGEEEIDFSGIEGLSSQAGAAANILSSLASDSSGTRCPAITHSDYRAESAQISRDLKDLPRQIRDERKNLVEKEAQLKENFADLNKDIADLDSDKRKQGIEVQNEKIQQQQQKERTLAQIAQELENGNKQIIRLQGQKANLLSNKSVELASFADIVVNRQCAAEVNKIYQEQMKIRGNGLNAARQGGRLKQAMQDEFESCKIVVASRRAAVIAKYDEQFNNIDSEIESLKSSITRMEEQMNSMQASWLQSDANSDLALQAAEQDYNTSRSNLLQRLVLMNDSWSKEQQVIQTNIQELQKELNKNSNKLATLERQRPPTSVNKTFADAMSEHSDYTSALEEFCLACQNSNVSVSLRLSAKSSCSTPPADPKKQGEQAQ